jgi:excisionase family DNA binding protein
MTPSQKVREMLASAEEDPLLTPGEVATVCRVDPKTVTRWAAAGRLPSVRTPGNHRRFRKSDVDAMLGKTNPAA